MGVDALRRDRNRCCDGEAGRGDVGSVQLMPFGSAFRPNRRHKGSHDAGGWAGKGLVGI